MQVERRGMPQGREVVVDHWVPSWPRTVHLRVTLMDLQRLTALHQAGFSLTLDLIRACLLPSAGVCMHICTVHAKEIIRLRSRHSYHLMESVEMGTGASSNIRPGRPGTGQY